MALEGFAKRLVSGAKVLDKMVGDAGDRLKTLGDSAGAVVGSATDRLKAVGDSAANLVTSATESISGTVIKDELVMIGKDGPAVITVGHLDEVPLTKERLELSYAPGGPALAPLRRVYAVGSTPVDAIKALGEKIGWGEVTNFLDQYELAAHGGSDEPGVDITAVALGGWYYRFTSDGTSMKAGGWLVPGGCVLDWWK